MKTFLPLIFFLGVAGAACAQDAFSLSTDASVLRSLTKGQRFWAFGQTVSGNFHFNPTWTGYATVGYYTTGKFKNNAVATARDSALPAQLDYTVRSELRFRQISLGVRRYLVGAYNNETTWNFYGQAGFGLLFGKVENFYSLAVDTVKYKVPFAKEGQGDFKRLTFDLALGVEWLLGASVYLYADLRTWIPASDFPSPYLYNNNTPRTVTAHGGIRVLFE